MVRKNVQMFVWTFSPPVCSHLEFLQFKQQRSWHLTHSWECHLQITLIICILSYCNKTHKIKRILRLNVLSISYTHLFSAIELLIHSQASVDCRLILHKYTSASALLSSGMKDGGRKTDDEHGDWCSSEERYLDIFLWLKHILISTTVSLKNIKSVYWESFTSKWWRFTFFHKVSKRIALYKDPPKTGEKTKDD